MQKHGGLPYGKAVSPVIAFRRDHEQAYARKAKQVLSEDNCGTLTAPCLLFFWWAACEFTRTYPIVPAHPEPRPIRGRAMMYGATFASWAPMGVTARRALEHKQRGARSTG
jgi:hypothetical protein